jgi:hypothetical protein
MSGVAATQVYAGLEGIVKGKLALYDGSYKEFSSQK